jgi:hypothetical protein
MPRLTRPQFAAAAGGLGAAAMTTPAADPPAGPTEAPFSRDYPPPGFEPGWKKPQLSRLLVQDFVIFAHSDLEMTKKLLAKEPALANAFMDWGGGDWESALGGASHMGRRDIAEFMLANGARMDVFAAAALGLTEVVKGMLAAAPALIDAKGPHGFSLHFHAQAAGKDGEPLLDYLQGVKKVELKPFPFRK